MKIKENNKVKFDYCTEYECYKIQGIINITLLT